MVELFSYGARGHDSVGKRGHDATFDGDQHHYEEERLPEADLVVTIWLNVSSGARNTPPILFTNEAKKGRRCFAADSVLLFSILTSPNTAVFSLICGE